MTSLYGPVGESGLSFFGKVAATACHELKNILAVIGENNGLLEDIVFMAQKGRPFDPERLGRACADVGKQIQRADDLLANVSRFAHSVDCFEDEIDLEDGCRLVVFLARRLTAAKRLTVEVAAAGAVRLAKANPLLIENLLWAALLEAADRCANGSALRVVVGERDGCPAVVFHGLENLDEEFRPTAPWTELLAAASARWEICGLERQCALLFGEDEPPRLDGRSS
ncbi:MAG: hypothetical protein LBU39_01960 [Desulfobulbaceae bacterium]|jgi:hypothetical protein|nr:hypothetical protein [Desulfobulbaceae bacterium]